jgi:uncharacterized SAM-binding protein YcdF (DUF218 family)
MMLPWLTWKLVRRVVVLLALAVLLYYLFTVFQVWRAAEGDDTRHSQALIVLGAAQYDGRPSPVFRARLDHTADLYRQGVAPVVVVTGGKQPGDRFTEATAGADYLHAKGVPDSAIMRETTGRSSWESLAASARFLQTRGIRRVVLVSDPFHSLRIRLIASELGFDAVTSPTRTSPIGGFEEWKRFFGEALRVALGRIFGFGRLARAAALAVEVPVGAGARGVAILGGPSGVV